MKRRKLILYCVLICLPAVLLVGAWAALLPQVPRWSRAQQAQVGREYRRLAEELVARPERGEQLGKRPKGWRKTSEIGGKAWGRGTDASGSFVWFQSGEKEWRRLRVESPAEFPYALVCYGLGGCVALVLIGLTALAVWSFVRFTKERDDFLAATAHDLTTPLVGMRMTVGRDDAEAKVLVERMIRLVQNLKDFLKLGRRPDPKAETFDLVEAYRSAYALFAADYRDLFDDEDVAVEGEATAMVRADETMTVQILWNLLGNDLKYAAPYGRVRVRFSHEGRYVKCEFLDEGMGMSPYEMSKAFDRYYRAKTVLELGKGGFGIGLCTAREFAQTMGGDLTVAANRPKGCVFALTLPAALYVQDVI